MNEPLVCWIALLLVTLWKGVTSTKYVEKRVLHKVAPKLGGLACLLEWYCIAIVLLVLFLTRMIYDLFKYDFYGEWFLTVPDLQKNIPHDHLQELALPPWLRWVAVVMPFVGIVGFIINVYHICHFVLRQKAEEEEEKKKKTVADYRLKPGDKVKGVADGQIGEGEVVFVSDDPDDSQPLKVRFKNGTDNWVGMDAVKVYVEETSPWHLNKSADLTLMVILMPAVFVVMAMKAELRMLEVFLGSTFDPEMEDFHSYALWRRCTYQMDLQCAAAFQYFTVVAFVRLCSQFLNNDDFAASVENTEKKLISRNNKLASELNRAPQPIDESSMRKHLKTADKEHRYALTLAGMQGLWSYIIVGFFRCIFAIVMACLVELQKNDDKKWKWLVEVSKTFKPVFVFTAFLCVYNWGIIQGMEGIKRKDALGASATWKFMGVRMLLLLGDGQKAGLDFLERSSWAGSLGLTLTKDQGDLLHAILLLFECALVVAWNKYMWPRAVGRSRADRGYGEPLLN